MYDDGMRMMVVDDGWWSVMVVVVGGAVCTFRLASLRLLTRARE